jgi:hypothetical protein
VPPWALFWLVSSLILVPGQLPTWRAALLDLIGVTPVTVDAGSGSGVLRLLDVVELVQPVLLAAAVAAVLAAPARGRIVRRTYRLTPASQRSFAEIVAFVHVVAPQVAVYGNIRRSDFRAFVYPTGYRRAALAVSGDLVLLWHRDRAAAEAVIRHELSHRDRADTLLLGVVSPLEAVLRRWGWILIAFVIVPVLVAWVAETTDFLRQVGAAGAAHKASQFLTLILPGLLWLLLATTARVLAAITMPVAASWSAELAADHEATKRAGAAAVTHALEARRPGGWTRWLFGFVTHPPVALRRALARAGTVPQALAAVSVYPVGWLVQLLCLMADAAAMDVGRQQTLSGIVSDERAGVATWAQNGWPAWAAALAVTLAWPALSRPFRSVAVTGRTAPKAISNSATNKGEMA